MSHVSGNATPVKWLGFYMSHPKGNNIYNFQMHTFFVGLGGAKQSEHSVSSYWQNKICLTFSPLSLETCRLSLISHLLPSTIFSTSAEACWYNRGQMSSTRWNYRCHLWLLRSKKRNFYLGWYVPPLCSLSSSWCCQRISRLWCRRQAWCPVKTSKSGEFMNLTHKNRFMSHLSDKRRHWPSLLCSRLWWLFGSAPGQLCPWGIQTLLKLAHNISIQDHKNANPIKLHVVTF